MSTPDSTTAFRSQPFAPLLLCLALSIVPSSVVLSQSAPSSPDPASGQATEKPISLAPFEVRTDQDHGYLAQNTTSGSRLNTSLKDTPAAISVFTEEFLNDIAVTDINTLSEYVLNLDRDVGLFSEFGGNPVGNNVLEFDAAFKVRGLPLPGGTGRSVNFFTYPIEIDTYNIERVEFSRGPNSILFGIAPAGGNFDITTKKAHVSRPHYRLGLRTSSNDEIRGTLDLNHPLVAGKLGVRLNLLGEDRNNWRPHEYKQAERLHVAARYQITPRTTLDVEYDKGDVAELVGRPWASTDFLTAWLAAGRPIDPAAGAPYPAGTVNFGTGARRVLDSATGEIMVWRNLAVSAPVRPSSTPLLTDFSLIPRDVMTAGPGAGRDVDYTTYAAFLRHEFVDNLFVEVAARRHEDSYMVRDVGGHHIQVDASAVLPTGAPNPNAGRAFIDSNFVTRDRWLELNDVRATVSYGFGLGRILGQHQLAGLAQNSEKSQHRISTFETLLTNPPNPDPRNGINRLFRRTYFDLGAPAGTMTQADYRLRPVNGIVNRSTALPEQTAFVPVTDANDEFETRTYMAATQSRFWDGRIVATVGYREDTLDERIASAEPNLVGDYTRSGLLGLDPTHRELKGATRTHGVVFHATKWLSLFYNHSSNFALPSASIREFPDSLVPPPEGEGDDMGVKFTLLDGRLFATVTRYETAAKQDASFGTGNSHTDTNFIWEALDAAGVLAANGRNLGEEVITANGFTFDSESEGWELELIANPTPNWRLLFNFSDNKTVRSNIGAKQRAYTAANRGFWLEGERGRLQEDGTLADKAIDPSDGSNLNTIAERLARIEDYEESTFLAPDGVRHAGNPRYSINFRTNYTFDKGVMKGFSAGGGVRWRGSPVLGYTSSDPATRELIIGPERFWVDANVGYRRRTEWNGRNWDWSVQLNVNNVLDNEDLIFTNALPDGTMRAYRLPTPRTWILSASLRL